MIEVFNKVYMQKTYRFKNSKKRFSTIRYQINFNKMILKQSRIIYFTSNNSKTKGINNFYQTIIKIASKVIEKSESLQLHYPQAPTSTKTL